MDNPLIFLTTVGPRYRTQSDMISDGREVDADQRQVILYRDSSSPALLVSAVGVVHVLAGHCGCGCIQRLRRGVLLRQVGRGSDHRHPQPGH